MAVLIALFNHKGGVSKTTTAFNLGWAMADHGKRVLIVDGDPQCNLTGTVLGFDGVSDFQEFYDMHPDGNISNCLDPIFQATGTKLKPAKITPATNPNLFLLPATSRSLKTRYRSRLHYRLAWQSQPSKIFQELSVLFSG